MDRSRASAISAAASLCCRGLLIAAAVTFSVPGSAQARISSSLRSARRTTGRTSLRRSASRPASSRSTASSSTSSSRRSGETMQVVIAGSVDIGTDVGTYGAMRAFAKGAPAGDRNATNGADDLYVRARDSPIRSIKDRPGRRSPSPARLLDQRHRARADQGTGVVSCRPRPEPATRSAVMSGQIDIGGHRVARRRGPRAGKSRLVVRGSDVASLRDRDRARSDRATSSLWPKSTCVPTVSPGLNRPWSTRLL